MPPEPGNIEEQPLLHSCVKLSLLKSRSLPSPRSCRSASTLSSATSCVWVGLYAPICGAIKNNGPALTPLLTSSSDGIYRLLRFILVPQRFRSERRWTCPTASHSPIHSLTHMPTEDVPFKWAAKHTPTPQPPYAPIYREQDRTSCMCNSTK